MAARSLLSLGISIDQVRGEVERIIGHGEQPTEGPIGFTPRLPRMELALMRQGAWAIPISVLNISYWA